MNSIRSVGVDIVEIARIKTAYLRWGRSFLEKIFVSDEIEYCMSKANPYPSLAGRFAAKEAAFKALSNAGIKVERWHHLIVCRSPEGLPFLYSEGVKGIELHLSISHTREMAVAMVVAQTNHGL